MAPFPPPVRRRRRDSGALIRRRKILRAKLYLLQGGRCFYCARPMLLSPTLRTGREGRRCTLDELQPQKHGGRSDPSNCVAACNRCNNRKGHRTALQFQQSWPPALQAKRTPRMLALRSLIIRRWHAGGLQVPPARRRR